MVVQGRVHALNLGNFFPEHSPLAQYLTAIFLYLTDVHGNCLQDFQCVVNCMDQPEKDVQLYTSGEAGGRGTEQVIRYLSM